MTDNDNFIIGENTDATIWTSAETCTAIICSCLPAIRALYKTGRSIASDAASKRKSATQGGSHPHDGKPSQLRSNDHDLRVGESKNKNDEVILLQDMDPVALVPSQAIGRAF